MAASDKNIVISPQRGSATLSPSLVFTGDGADPISIYALDGTPGSLSFEGSAGQLFSITNNLTSGSIFSVNDVSGIPSLDIDANGTVSIASYGGSVGIGTASPSSSYKLDVLGDVRIDGNLTITQTTTISGLNADKLDGLDSSQFLRSDTTNISTGGTLEIRGGTAADEAQIKLDATQAGSPQIGFGDERDNTGDNYWAIGADDTDISYFKFATRNNTGIPSINNNTSSEVKFTIEYDGNLWAGPQDTNKIWHSGNDGSGSGLDADLLDGQQGSYYQPASSALTTSTTFGGDVSGTYNAIVVANDSHTHDGRYYTETESNARYLGISAKAADSDLLDGIDSGSFVRSDANDTISSQISFTSTGNPITTNAIVFNNTESSGYYSGGTGTLAFDENFYSDAGYGTGTYDPDTIFTGGNGGGLLIKNEDGWGAIFTTQNTRWASAEWENLKVGSNQVWHAGNDGSGSGLDADLLDGQQGSYYQPASSALTTSTTFGGDVSGTYNNLQIADDSHNHTQIYSKGNYVWTESTAPRNFPDGISLSFVQSSNGWQSYGTIVNFHTYSNDGATGQIYFPYSGVYGGNSMQYRLGLYNNAGWTSWKTPWDNTNDGSGSGLDADLLDGQQGSYYQPASSALTTSTSFGGDVSGTYNAIVVANDSHTHDGRYFTETESDARYLGISAKATDSNLLDGIDSASFLRSDANDSFSGNLTGSGTILTTGTYMGITGDGGGVVMTTNDGYGNANLCFNHRSGIPDANGSACRIETSVDNSTGFMLFEIGDNVTSGTAVTLTETLKLTTSDITYKSNAVWHAGNDGSGSGLDADTLDGIDSASFLRSDASDTFTGILDINGTITVDCGNTTTGLSVRSNSGSSNSGRINLGFGNGANNPKIQFDDVDNDMFWGIGAHDSPNNLYIWGNAGNSLPSFESHTGGTTSSIQFEFTTAGSLNIYGSITAGNGNTVWHAGNDGSGSGLDADLLDGQQGSYYQQASTALTTSTTFGGDVSGTYNAIVVANDSHTHNKVASHDDRIIEPNADTTYNMHFGFTSWANNNTAPYADYLHLRSYSDSSGGSDNLVMFKKSGIGMRIWQQTFGSSTAYSSYVDVWHSGNDGSGSGLDADLLDGLNSGSFLRSDAADTASGQITLTYGDQSLISQHNGTTDGWRGRILVKNSSADKASFLGTYGSKAGVFSHNHALNAWADLYVNTVDGYVGGTVRMPSSVLVNGSQVWHAGNDGSGSGLDADLLDGIDSTGFLQNYYETAINSPDVVSGTWTTATSSSWGDPKFNNTHDQNRYADGSAYVQYNIPSGYKSCWISQLQWDSGGYADCYGVQSDGGLVFLRRINTRQTVENTNEGDPDQHDGMTITHVGSGLDHFTAIRIQNRVGRIHLTGIAWTKNDNAGYEGTGMVHPAQISHQGSGSGLDADLLDGLNSGSFLRSDADDTFTRLTGTRVSCGYDSGVDNSVGCSNWFRSSGSTGWYNASYGGGWFMQDTTWIRSYNSRSIYQNAGTLRTDGTFQVGSSGATFQAINGGAVTISGNTAWHAGNDGSGSGLDADLLDGLNSSSFFRSDTSNAVDVRLTSANGRGLRFWDDDAYKIWMSSIDDVTWGGRLDSTSDYNMYFKMGGGTNRGFIFKNNTTNLFQIEGSGQVRCIANILVSGDVIASDILPHTDNTGVVGNSSLTWNNGQFTNLTVDGTLSVRAAIDLADSNILRLGSSDDWEFFHNGTHNYMDLNVGNLYIRDNATTRFTFEKTTGNFIATGNVTAYSDITLKENIEVIPNAIEKLQTLHGITYTRKDCDENTYYTGVIAQEVEKVLPEAVQTNEEGIKSVAYGNMVGLLIEAIKEQQKQIDMLKGKLGIE